jgi:large subunit ribosomal protein L18
MKAGPRYHVKPRRQREGKTDYRRRLRLLKSRKTRIVVRRSNKNTQVQFIGYQPTGDQIIASAISKELISKYNWKFSTSTTSAAYLTGLLAGTRAKQQGVEEGILDIGMLRPTAHSKVFAALKGVIDAGIQCPHDEEKIPDKNRIHGKHLNEKIAPMVDDLKDKIIGGK